MMGKLHRYGAMIEGVWEYWSEGLDRGPVKAQNSDLPEQGMGPSVPDLVTACLHLNSIAPQGAGIAVKDVLKLENIRVRPARTGRKALLAQLCPGQLFNGFQ